MYDNPDQVDLLMMQLEDAVPLRTRLPQRLRLHLATDEPGGQVPAEGWIKEAIYAGDDLGIMCVLDLGAGSTEKVEIVAITHLDFDPREPLTREIRSYQKHRVKRLKTAGRIGRVNEIVDVRLPSR